MNKYLQVAQTYAIRPRFWILGLFYVAMLWWWWIGVDRTIQALMSVNTAAIVGCFLALHVRRQFACDAAQLTPGYAAPHLVVGALAGLAPWLLLPATRVALKHWPPGALAFHAVAGLVVAAVVCWPRAIALLAATPVVFVLAVRLTIERGSFLNRLMLGQEAWYGYALLAAALLRQVVAGFVLVRLSGRSAASDELAVEPEVTSEPAGRWREWNLERRDAVVGSALFLAPRQWAWQVRRWRMPVAIAWSQLALPLVPLAAVATARIWVDPELLEPWWLAAMFITTSVIMIAPYGPWQGRRKWLATELTLPVTRGRFFYQLAGALALDVATWTGVACAMSGVALGSTALLAPHPVHTAAAFAGHVLILSSMATLLYGLALLTFGVRYWIPLIVVLGGVWAWIAWGVILSDAVSRHTAPGLESVYIFAGASIALGLTLALLARRRWLSMDIS